MNTLQVNTSVWRSSYSSFNCLPHQILFNQHAKTIGSLTTNMSFQEEFEMQVNRDMSANQDHEAYPSTAIDMVDPPTTHIHRRWPSCVKDSAKIFLGLALLLLGVGLCVGLIYIEVALPDAFHGSTNSSLSDSTASFTPPLLPEPTVFPLASTTESIILVTRFSFEPIVTRSLGGMGQASMTTWVGVPSVLMASASVTSSS